MQKVPINNFVLVAFVMVAYDAMASLVSRFAGVDYKYSMFGSLLLCVLAGFFVGWRTSFVWGIAAGMAAGLAESTVGWVVSNWIGPTTAAAQLTFSTELILFTIFVVTMSSMFFAAVGSALATLIKRLS